MKALILNSGRGTRMGEFTINQPKCMTEISEKETIISRQLKQLSAAGIREVVITTGPFDESLINYCSSLELPLKYTFVKNEKYADTNYIYSIYRAKEYLDDDILLMHGDLVFEDSVLRNLLSNEFSCMAVSSSCELPEKDFKAVLQGNIIKKIGIEFFNNAMAAQPIYKLLKHDWRFWLDNIVKYCKTGLTTCYAEVAFNEVSDQCNINAYDIKSSLCSEVDTPEDLKMIKAELGSFDKKTVYMCFSTDMLHSGHISIINKAKQLGELTVGVLSDDVVASYKRYPLVPFEDRKILFENISGVHAVVEQDKLSYTENIRKLKPAYVVHGDDWVSGFQKPIREEVISVLNEYGGELIEYPYDHNAKYKKIESNFRSQLSMPDNRRGRLRRLLGLKKTLSIIEAHSGITGLIAEKTVVYEDGKAFQFDGMWVSSLCDSTVKGKPDIELVDMSSRIRTIEDIMEVTTKPIILDGDTGGQIEHFVYNVRTLERIGVSAVIIEDKIGLKKNSLFGTEVEQTQDSIQHFCRKIEAGKKAQKTEEFMIIARIESLILEKGMEDALARAFAYVEAGADGLMIHSRKKDGNEIFEFVDSFRKKDKNIPIVVVPTSFNSIREEEFSQHGVNIVIYANQLTRSGFPAMQHIAETILKNHRAQEADKMCMPIKEILTLIPEE